MEKQLGSVEAGKLADLLVLDADPLADVPNIRKIHTVIRPVFFTILEKSDGTFSRPG